ncbi:hypothetical protein A7985_17215 [Pseudoalteromonas luteoviolacea]|uniref:Acyltransferase 3 domain-containing protein n=1 Tax=Pseudoalteromonas luteoviolacea TaxID=43657 RepID=A0A1C0TMX9_9GAMM|nr:acyltransferase [Pseudoalteromonas luteoviolacea]OCQ20172.1 hypothetical protein A7985_17215 [Pseudoalteromonas luteoviolacea]
MKKIDQKVCDLSDWFRGIGCMYISFAHLLQAFYVPINGVDTFFSIFSYDIGEILIMIFFVISGVFIMNSILDNIERFDGFHSRLFIASRVDRVYPPLLFALTLSVGVYFFCAYFQITDLGGGNFPFPILREHVSFDFKNYVFTFLLLNEVIKGIETIGNNGPLWSVALEFNIYMLACAAIMFAVNRNVYAGLIAILFLMYQIYSYNTQYFIHLACWIMGAVSCLHLRGLIKINRSLLGWGLLLCCLYLVGHYGYLIPEGRAVVTLFELTRITLIFMLICIFIKSLYLPSWLWCFKGYAYFSYTLYLVHFPIYLLAFSLIGESFMEFSLLLKIVSASLLYAFTVMLSAYLARRLESVSYFRKMVLNKSKPVKAI